MVLGAGVVGLGALKMRNTPISCARVTGNDEGYLHGQMLGVKSSFRRAYNLEFPAMKVNVDDNGTQRVSFEFATAKNLDHLKVFNKMLELFHLYKNPKVLDVEKTTRKFKSDVVIYSFAYRTMNQDNNRTTVYLVGDTKKNKYTVTLEKDGRFDKIELMILINIAKRVQKYEASYKTEEVRSEHTNSEILTFISSFGCKVIEAKKNFFDVTKCFGSTSIQDNVKEIIKSKQRDNT
jgi:hypothetical protein